VPLQIAAHQPERRPGFREATPDRLPPVFILKLITMKNKKLFLLCSCAFAAAMLLNVHLAYNSQGTLSLSTSNVEALASGETPITDVSQCDIQTWVRNAYEDYEEQLAPADYKIGGTFSFGGHTYTVQITFDKGDWMRVPICRELNNNCCLKSHLEKEVTKINK